ncbi:galactokinase, partial [Staphylococcus cohnii]
GCAIALVDKNSIQPLEDEVSKAYIDNNGYAPSFYNVGISDGVKAL